MKHPALPTILIVVVFLLAQLTGLGLLAADITTTVDNQTGEVQAQYSDTVGGPRPETSGAGSFIFIAFGVGIGTILLLVLARYKLQKLWKVWYFLAVWIAMAIALGAVIPSLIAYTLAFILALAKILRRNTIIHNVSEILIYTGIAFLIVPLFDVLWASILLITIAVYDIIAVFKSKHMISLAKFQTESNVFAGLQIPYANKPTKLRTHAPKNVKKTTKKMRSAILGGGDIVFPLLFSGAILQWLVTSGYTPLQAYLFTLIPTAAAAIGLVVLFKVAQKDKFYPAMPPLAAGCFVGLLIVSLLV